MEIMEDMQNSLDRSEDNFGGKIVKILPLILMELPHIRIPVLMISALILMMTATMTLSSIMKRKQRMNRKPKELNKEEQLPDQKYQGKPPKVCTFAERKALEPLR